MSNRSLEALSDSLTASTLEAWDQRYRPLHNSGQDTGDGIYFEIQPLDSLQPIKINTHYFAFHNDYPNNDSAQAMTEQHVDMIAQGHTPIFSIKDADEGFDSLLLKPEDLKKNSLIGGYVAEDIERLSSESIEENISIGGLVRARLIVYQSQKGVWVKSPYPKTIDKLLAVFDLK